ncbi:MAG: putative glycoside hydrolase, partial [Actinomycetota bacterium]
GTVRTNRPSAPVTTAVDPAETRADGRFVLTVPAGSTLVVERPVWGSVEVPVPAAPGEDLVVELQPMVVRGLRVAKEVARDRIRFDELLALTEGTTVNTLVFDTKDETNVVLYDTEVEFAHDIGAVEDVYDPAELLALAREHDLYAVTRIVTFEDGGWAQARPEAKLAGSWVDAGNEDNWAYPLALAEEACALGFDEVQFDYVRFPAGRTAEAAASRLPPTSDARADVIARFLTEARDRLHPMGCGVSAAIFGIVMSSETDEGIGQTPETVSSAVDAVSPMLYPSHYGPGWLGFADPNDHPGPVIAHALDTGEPKVESNVLIRPWIQGFDYNGQQVQAQITESEARGAGWIIWNYPGNYRRDWLPSA